MQKKPKMISFIIVIGLTGCDVPYINLDSQSRDRLRQSVKVYSPEELTNLKYNTLGPIDGVSCKYYPSDPDASREDAIDRLRHDSIAMAANGLTNLVCQQPQGYSLDPNCYNSVTCKAVAIRVEPVLHTPNVASAQELKPGQGIEESRKEVVKRTDTIESQDVKQFKSGVVKITAKPTQGTSKSGTGFIVRLDKEAAYIVTAAHVIAGDPQPDVEFFTKRNVPVRAEVLGLEGDDELRGLAVVVVRGQENLPSGLAALPMALRVRLEGGQGIVTIGFPRSAGPWATITGTIVSRRGRILDIAAALDEGNSGGPLIQDDKVVGMVAGMSQSFGRGVTAASVVDYLDGFGISPQ